MADRHSIRNRDIDKRIRLVGRIARTVMPYYKDSTFSRMGRLEKRIVKGHWLSRKTYVKTEFATRADGSRMRILVCRSRNFQASEPVTGVLWIHGGGYAMGLPEQEFMFASLFSASGNAITVLPDYTKSTEKAYPAALEDCALALTWMYENAQRLGIDRSQIFVGGESAGGGLTAALCLYARDRLSIPIAFQMPLYPMIDDREIQPSAKGNDAPVWNTRSNRVGWDMYLAGLDRSNVPIYAAPARAENLEDLPPACTYVGTIDPFHDETVDYFRRLEEAEVPVSIMEFEGCFHAFDLYGYSTSLGKDARAFLSKAFRHAQENYRSL